MPVRVVVCFLVLGAACGWELSLGPADGVAPFRFEASLANPAMVDPGPGPVAEVSLSRDVVMISAERSRHYLDRFGADRIAALRGITLTVVEMRIEGADLGQGEPPEIVLAGHVMAGVPGETATLDRHQVNQVRARLLAAEAIELPLSITLATTREVLAEGATSLHIVLVVQPTLLVDATRVL
jgi:hypothetical protein